MPGAASIPAPPVQWYTDVTHPLKPQPPTAAGVASQVGWVASVRTVNGVSGLGVPGAANTGAGNISNAQVTANQWCHSFVTPLAGSSRFWLFRINGFTPDLDRTTAPALDDRGSRVGWFRVFLYEGGTAADTADACGIGFCPTDMRDVTAANFHVPLVGGFGIYKRLGLNSFRYVSYSAAPVLLEAQNLASAANTWHVADFVIRAAKRGDATTPWLTFAWNGVDVFTRRLFGHALLATPQSVRALAFGWDVLRGCVAAQGSFDSILRFRAGPFLPDGTPVI